MAEYTLLTTDEQDAILAWHVARLPQPPENAQLWLQAQQDALLDALAIQKRMEELSEVTTAYQAKSLEEQSTILVQLRALVGLP